MWDWQKTRKINQWNRIQSPEIDLYKYSQMIFVKGAKALQWEKKKYFPQMTVEQLDTYMQKKKKKNLDADLTPFTKVSQNILQIYMLYAKL